MSLAHRDFLPRSTPALRAGGALEWEPLSVVVARANEWLTAAGLRAVNIETLLLPASKQAPSNSMAGGLTVRWDEDHTWMQVVRVWHEVPPVGVAPAPMAATATSSPVSEEKYQPPG